MRDDAASVIGRDDELESLQAFLDAVEQGPTALLISGEAGIGKTVLWEEGVGRAQERVEHVLVHRSVEAEALLSFTGLSDLVAPILDEVASSLAPLRRRALEVALLLAEPGREPPDPRVIGFALLDVLQALAESGPVVIALDDVQWLDPSSAGVLQIALRRLGDERVGLVATLRKVPSVAAPFELENAFADERLERLWLRPLSLAALHHLLKERLGLDLTRPELARIQETSGGNPFFALELGREMVRTETRPAAGRGVRQRALAGSPARATSGQLSSWSPQRTPSLTRRSRHSTKRFGRVSYRSTARSCTSPILSFRQFATSKHRRQSDARFTGRSQVR